MTSSAPSLDNLAWLPDKSGIYTTKTGYGLGMTSEREDASYTSNFNWVKNIWNVKTSPKIKDFLWKVVRKAIPVSSNLATRGVPAFNCKSCDMGEDDLHVFLHCKVADQVWRLAPLVYRPITSFTSMASFIAGANQLTVLPPTGVSVPLWPWILWNLWKARNKLCFENRAFSGIEIILKSISDAREWQVAQYHILQTSTQAPVCRGQPRSTAGLEAGSRTVICNVDAAWDALSRNCGIGGMFSGWSPCPSLAPICESRNFVSSALMAEALAIRSAVMYAASSNVKSLMIRSDSLSLVKLLKERGSVPALFGILFDIYHFSSSFDVVSFSYVPRLSNVLADSLAKSALSLLNSSGNGV